MALYTSKNPFINVGLSWGAIGIALFNTALFLSFVIIYPADEEFPLHIIFSLLIGMIEGAIIGSIIGLFASLIYRVFKPLPHLQKTWAISIFILLLATMPWFYQLSWGAFGYRWVINDLVEKQENALFEALLKYDTQDQLSRDSMHVYTYEQNTVTLHIANKSASEERFWIVVYKLAFDNDIWKVTDVYGRCPSCNCI